MTTANGGRRQKIAWAITRAPGDAPANTLALWERLSFELTAIIGDTGFQSLFHRSLRKVQVTFPWLAGSLSRQAAVSQFSNLAISLQTREPAEAGQASILLLDTFLTILSTLVGETLTMSILDAALGDDARDATSEESNNA